MSNNEMMDSLFGAKKEASSDQLSNISDLMQIESDLRSQMETAAGMVADYKRQLNHLTNEQLPAAMAEAGVEEFTSSKTGNKVKLTFSADGTIGPKSDPNREKKIDRWIELGAGEIVKQSVTVSFPKEKFESATELANSLRRTGRKIIVHLDEHQSEEDAVELEHQIKLICNNEVQRIEGGYENVLEERSINANSLKAFIKQRMEGDGSGGDPLPLDELGCWYGQTAKITRAKAQG